MKMDLFYNNENEKPLENLANDTGMTAIFRTIACVGDSLSSGEFELCDSDNKHSYYDLYNYSWGQHIARTCGNTVYNFSRGGMTAKWYGDFALERDLWNPEKSAQAYIFALGCNDQRDEYFPGSINDVDMTDPEKCKNTFMGCYAKIMMRYKQISPDAKFFLMTLPRDVRINSEKLKAHRKAVYELAEVFDNTYVLDLMEFAPEYDEKFREVFFLNGHMNPQGYVFTAKMVMAYIDYIIRHNMKDFEFIWKRHAGLDLA